MTFVRRASILSVSLVAGTLLAAPAFAQALDSGTGDAAAKNQRSTVGVGMQTGSGGPGYRYGWAPAGGFYGEPVYSGRSVVVTPYGYMVPVEPE